MFIDVHCHIETYRDIKEVVDRAKEVGVNLIINNSISFKSMKKSLMLSEWFSEIKSALGVYPIEALKINDNEFNDVLKFILENKNKIVAIGEVGIDLKWSNDFENQRKRFLKFIELSKKLDLPLIVHSRKAEKQVIEILENEKCEKVVMHCFSAGSELVERVIKNNWMFTIPTNVVFNKAIQDIAKKVSLKNLLCETDSPYFHPFHGKRNEPCYVIESYKKIAELKLVELEDVEEQVEENFYRLFKING